MQDHDPTLLENLKKILSPAEAEWLAKRDYHYASSWKEDGGIGAFFTIQRPWHRLRAIAKRAGFDIFKVIQEEQDKGLTAENDGTIQACIRDLRCYMALLEAEAMRMKRVYNKDSSTPEPQPGESHASLRYIGELCQQSTDIPHPVYGDMKGYYLLEAEEIIQQGDEWFSPEGKCWVKCDTSIGRYVKTFSTALRRKKA